MRWILPSRTATPLVIVTADHETGGLQKNGTNYTFSHGTHSGVDVPVFAMGKGAENFQGNMINTDIPNIIRALFENDVAEPTESAISENPRLQQIPMQIQPKQAKTASSIILFCSELHLFLSQLF